MTHRELTAGVGRPEGFRRPALVPESECEGELRPRSVRDPFGHDVTLARCVACGRTVVIDETDNCMLNEYGGDLDRPIEVRPSSVPLDTMHLGAAGVSIERAINKKLQSRIRDLEGALRGIVDYWSEIGDNGNPHFAPVVAVSLDSMVRRARLVLDAPDDGSQSGEDSSGEKGDVHEQR